MKIDWLIFRRTRVKLVILPGLGIEFPSLQPSVYLRKANEIFLVLAVCRTTANFTYDYWSKY